MLKMLKRRQVRFIALLPRPPATSGIRCSATSRRRILANRNRGAASTIQPQRWASTRCLKTLRRS
jgi:hypothetical protein